MSGRNRRILYYVVTTVFGFAAVACAVLMAVLTAREWAELPAAYLAVYIAAAACLLLLHPGVLVHEAGHLLFGACAGMKCVSFSVGFFSFSPRGKKVSLRISPTAGETQLIPNKTSNMRRRMMAATLGGALLNFTVGTVFAVLFFLLPNPPALLFFELLAPFQLYEAVAAILPAELNAGKTDGALFSELKKKTDEADVLLRVLTAQGMLEKGSFSDLPQELLFSAPVVREDCPYFLSLLHMRYQWLLYRGDERGAAEQIFRLEDLSDYLPDEERAQVQCDAAFMRYVLNGTTEFDAPERAKKSAAYERIAAVRNNEIQCLKLTVRKERSNGIRELEETLIDKYFKQ